MSGYTNDPLKLGATGRAVQFLQMRLGIGASGDFDVVTEDALKRAQLATSNQADGVYGPMTNAALTMAHTDTLVAMAESIRVSANALKALLTVETTGRGFYTNGLPKILLERHYVYRLATDAQRDLLPPDVCNPTPGGYVGDLGEWSRFDAVASINQDLAIQSCSWGIAQIMGLQAHRLGMSPSLFMLAHCKNEDGQLNVFGRYIASSDTLRGALQVCDWPEVARLYNGENYAANHYDTKLASAYAKLQSAD